MSFIDDKLLTASEKALDKVLKDSENWSIWQKVAGFLLFIIVGGAMLFRALAPHDTSAANYLLAIGGGVLALYGIAFLTMPRRALESKALVIRDKAGRGRILLDGETGMVFFDENMRVRLLAGVQNGVPVVHLGSALGTLATVAVEENGGTISLMRMDHPKQPGIYFNLTESGDASASVGALKGARVALTGAADGEVGVLLETTNGRQAPAVFSGVGAEAHLTFFDENAQRIARYPSKMNPSH